MREPLRIKHFDVDPEWMGKYKNTEQARFRAADLDDERLEIIKSARGGGSTTPLFNKRLKKHLVSKKLKLFTETSLVDAKFLGHRRRRRRRMDRKDQPAHQPPKHRLHLLRDWHPERLHRSALPQGDDGEAPDLRRRRISLHQRRADVERWRASLHDGSSGGSETGTYGAESRRCESRRREDSVGDWGSCSEGARG